MCQNCPKKCPRCGSTRGVHQTFEIACPAGETAYKCDCGATWCER